MGGGGHPRHAVDIHELARRNGSGDSHDSTQGIESKTARCRFAYPGRAAPPKRLPINDFIWRENPPGMLIGWARELARRGFATLAISPKGSVTRRP